MWRLQLKSVRKEYQRTIQLIGVTLALHLVTLCTFFFTGSSTINFRFQIESSLLKNDVPVVFMPLQKRVTQPAKSGIKKVPHTSKAPPKKAAPAAKPATTMQTKKEPPKPVEKKVVPQKKETPKKIDAPKKNQEQIKKEEPKEVPPVPVAQTENKISESSVPETTQDALVVGQEERDAIEMQRALQEEMARVWRPPVGVSKDLNCQVAITFDWHGTIKEIKIEKGSGMHMYDTSVRQAVHACSAPRWAYGKTVSINFRQTT